MLEDPAVLDWVRETAGRAARLSSVCTGALVLARAGLLTGRRATTHWGALDRLRELDRSIDVVDRARFVDDGVITSAGVAAGIDMAFHLVAQACGVDVAIETARYIDYPWSPLRPRPGTEPDPG